MGKKKPQKTKEITAAIPQTSASKSPDDAAAQSIQPRKRGRPRKVLDETQNQQDNKELPPPPPPRPEVVSDTPPEKKAKTTVDDEPPPASKQERDQEESQSGDDKMACELHAVSWRVERNAGRPFRVDPLQCLSANWLNNRFSAADFQLGDGGPDIWLCGGYWTLAVGPESNALDVLLESDLRTLVAQGEGYRSISVFIEILNAGFSVGSIQTKGDDQYRNIDPRRFIWVEL
ncbi:hypothetical protein SDJN03_08216, partial [Cucurbita argyrosperma subsp. sororia]